MNKEVMHSVYEGHPETVASDTELSDYLSRIAEERETSV